MKKQIITISLSLITLWAIGQSTWQVDRVHSNIKFTVTHMMISEVEGKFNEFEGSVNSTTEDFDGAKVTFSAKSSSIDTDNERRDNHLRSDDFFNAEEHPEIKFDGQIEKEGSKYYLVGKFTMRETTKDVKFDVKYNGSIEGRNGKIAGFKVTGIINRFDYGLKWDRTIEAGGLVVGEDVDITCNIELREQKN